MKFNMGCGRRKVAGYHNVDSAADCEPDEVLDLESTPWPWPSDCAEEIRFIHSLEHLGADPKVFLAILRETYRIGAPGCRVVIHVPHPRHDFFMADPTHVRPILPDTLAMFDRRLNAQAGSGDGANSPLALHAGVDFEMARSEIVLDEPYWSRVQAGELSSADAVALVASSFNVARELRFELRVRKPFWEPQIQSP